METLHNGFTLDVHPGVFPFSTDSMVLSHFARLPKNARVLDLGAGSGCLGLLLCAKDPGCTVTGVELDEKAVRCARENILRNNLESRMSVLHADLKDHASLFAPGSFQCVISNPPYFGGGPASRSLHAARQEENCRLTDIFRAAQWALQYGGDFFLVHRPDRMAEMIHLACLNQLEPKRLCLLRHKPDLPISLVLLSCKKGGKPGMQLEEITLFNQDGSPTQRYRDIYHIEEEL